MFKKLPETCLVALEPSRGFHAQHIKTWLPWVGSGNLGDRVHDARLSEKLFRSAGRQGFDVAFVALHLRDHVDEDAADTAVPLSQRRVAIVVRAKRFVELMVKAGMEGGDLVKCLE